MLVAQPVAEQSLQQNIDCYVPDLTCNLNIEQDECSQCPGHWWNENAVPDAACEG